MAGSALLEREIEKMTGGAKDSAPSRDSEEEREHQRLIEQNFRDLVESKPAAAYQEYSGYEAQPDRSGTNQSYQYYSEDRHAPVVPNSPQAPSASSRIADYMAASRNLENMRLRLEESLPQAPEASAPVQDFSSAPGIYRQNEAYSKEEEEYIPYEEYLYQQGILMDASLAPEQEKKGVPIFSPSYMPDSPRLPEEEDSRPTRRTLEYRYDEEAEDNSESHMYAGLSNRTKIILGAICAAVILLLAIICINTAVLKSINSGNSNRETTLEDLNDQLTGIESEIERVTSPDFLQNWAAEHGMTPPES